MADNELQKFVLAVEAGENAVAKDLLKKAMAKKVAAKLAKTIHEQNEQEASSK